MLSFVEPNTIYHYHSPFPQPGEVAQLVGHTLGLWHEDERPDAGQYVTINGDNVVTGAAGNFFVVPGQLIDTLGQPYDYGSIMHNKRDVSSALR